MGYSAEDLRRLEAIEDRLRLGELSFDKAMKLSEEVKQKPASVNLPRAPQRKGRVRPNGQFFHKPTFRFALTHEGTTQDALHWEADPRVTVSAKTIYKRKKLGFSDEQALFTPKLGGGKYAEHRAVIGALLQRGVSVEVIAEGFGWHVGFFRDFLRRERLLEVRRRVEKEIFEQVVREHALEP